MNLIKSTASSFQDKYLQVWLLILALKLLLGATLPLFSDEAYYWVWGQNLQLSYYDHPPFIAWLLSLGSYLGSPFDRFPLIIFSHLALWFWHLTVKSQLSKKELSIFWALYLASPLLGVGSILATPDAPLMVFWALATKIFFTYSQAPNFRRAFAWGLILGLGFCAKYHMVLFPFFALLWVLSSSRWDLLRLRLLVGIIAGLVLASAPVWLWNYWNDWISFKFQLGHGLKSEKSYKLWWTTGYLFSQLAILTPFLIPALWKSRGKNLWNFLAWGPLLFFLLTSFKAKVEANWPIVAFPALYFLAAKNIQRCGYWLHSIFWGVLTVLVILSVWISIPGFNRLKSNEYRYFSVLHTLPQKYSPLYGSTYQISSLIWYNSGTPVFKLRHMNRRDFFDSLKGSLPQESTFYVVSQAESALPAWVKDENISVSVVEELTPDFKVYKLNRP